MRMNKGMPFMDTPADYSPKGWKDKTNPPPTFSEAFLYATIGKDEARFVLGVAEEYEHVISALGPKATRLILDVKPKLSRRLGLSKRVIRCLEDAASPDFELREARFPSQIILDHDAAHSVWQILHDEYKRHFNPEADLHRDMLRAYNTLTDGLGDWEQGERRKEREKLPEKLKKQEERKAELAARKARRTSTVATIQDVLSELNVKGTSKGGTELDPELIACEVERALRSE